MPPKKTVTKSKSPGVALSEYQKVLNRVRKDPKYKNKSFAEQQQVASKLYHK
jgi:hypothetical protein